MSATTAIFHKPFTTKITFSPKPKSPKTLSSPQFPSSKNLVFSGDSVSRKSGSWDSITPCPNTTTVSTRIAAFRGSADDEEVRALEQEDLFSGSSNFSSNSIANGIESTLNDTSKWIVTVLFAILLIWKHDAEALWTALGSLLNVGLSTALKPILNQDRPISASKSDPGMPSSHAQSIFFSVMFAVLSLVQWLGLNGPTITLSGIAFAFGSYLSWLRVSQNFHTADQVFVGAALGSLFSILWFWSWDAVVLKAFISHLWVRISIVLGASVFCLAFLLYIIRHWIMDEE